MANATPKPREEVAGLLWELKRTVALGLENLAYDETLRLVAAAKRHHGSATECPQTLLDARGLEEMIVDNILDVADEHARVIIKRLLNAAKNVLSQFDVEWYLANRNHPDADLYQGAVLADLRAAIAEAEGQDHQSET
jgi:hypothetical protein